MAVKDIVKGICNITRCKYDVYTKERTDEFNTYLTEETFTGKYWVNGKKIYRKTINLGTLPNNEVYTVLHNINDLDYMISIRGTAYRTLDSTYFPIPYTSVDDEYSIQLTISKELAIIQTKIDRSTIDNCWVILEYTKTTE